MAMVACGEDEENGPSFEFINQNLQGSINGETWNFESGDAGESTFDEGQLFVTLYGTMVEDPCEAFGVVGNSVFFSIPNEIGVHELHLNFEEGSGQTATLFDDSETLNIIATEGAIELISNTNGTLTGRMDARGNDNSAVNGNFSVPICQ